MAPGTPEPGPPHPPVTPELRWRRVFPGHGRELAALRRWLSSFLPACPALGDVLVIANELGSNAIEHTASGQGGWFAVEVTWHRAVVQVVVADCGGPGEPRVINDLAAERGRGLRLVQGLSVRTGFGGDRHGRLVWAQIAWNGPAPVGPLTPEPYLAEAREAEAARARRPAWAASLAGAK
jgi:hypothetical protein